MIASFPSRNTGSEARLTLLPGTKYSAGRVLRTLLKRGWLIIVPLAASALAAATLRPSQLFRPAPSRSTVIGATAVVLFGVALVALLEYRDTSFRREDEVTRVLSLPVLAAVPLMTTRIERRAYRRHLAVTLASVIALIGSAAIAVVWWKMQP